jgi:hypothetical protein
MYNTRERIAVLVTLMLLLFVSQTVAQTKVIWFQIGKSSYDGVKDKLPKKVQITVDDGKLGACDYGGPIIITKGTGYGIDGLESVRFCFDARQTLIYVHMILEERRLNDIKKILASKYQAVRSEYPDTFLLFKANRDYVHLYLPWDNRITVDYMIPAVYRREKLQEHQTVEYNKKYERENKKALEREAAEEAAKF